jgi:hypothetical protein
MGDEEQALPVRQEGSITKRLAAAQAEMSNPTLDGFNPHLKSRFASLASVRNAVVPVLAKHGIATVQNILRTPTGVQCTTTLYCGVETMVFGPFDIDVVKMDAQGLGAAATYARRYQLMALACVSGDFDDDAESVAVISPEQAATLIDLLEKAGALESAFLEYFKVPTIASIPQRSYQTAVDMIAVRTAVAKAKK